MIYRITQYIQPWEIDDLERQVNQLIKGSYYIDEPKNIIFDCTLNLSIVDWQNSLIPKVYFVNKYKCLETRINQYFTAEFDTDESIQGVTDKRRSIQNKTQDFVIWLDSDVYFSVTALHFLVEATKHISEKVYMISPQIIKYWDSSWDSIVAREFLSMPFNHRDFFDMYSLDFLLQDKLVSITLNNTVKFGGGWFNLFTTSFFNSIPIDLEIGSYGPDDTYVSYCAVHKKIPQYILNNVIVSEIGKRLSEEKDYIKPLLTTKIKEKEKITDQKLFELIEKFILNNDK